MLHNVENPLDEYREELTEFTVKIFKLLGKEPDPGDNDFIELRESLEDLFEYRAQALEDYIRGIEIQEARAILSRDLKLHRHDQTGRVLIPYKERY